MKESRFFIGGDGSMYRDDEFSRPFREKFEYTFSTIKTTSQFKATLRNGAWAWPGGYPLYFIMEDSEAMCFKCAKEEAKQIILAMRDGWHTGWEVAACDVNYEDNELHCCHCHEKIESAYGSDESDEEEAS